MGMGPRLVVLNVTDPSAPAVVWRSQPTSGVIRGVTVSGGFAYVTGKSGVMIYDLSNPVAPVLRGTYLGASEDGSVGVIEPGRYICLAKRFWGLEIVDVSNPDSPVRAAVCDLSGEGYSYGVMISGSKAYVVMNSFTCIVDVSDPTSPALVDHLWVWESSEAAIMGGYMFAVLPNLDEPSAMAILDISNPPTVLSVGYCELPGTPRSVSVSGNRAYVSMGEDGLAVVDISNLAAPFVTAVCSTPGIATQSRALGTTAYVAADYGGLQVVDANDPNTPSVVGNHYASANARKVELVGSLAYVADWEGGLLVLDISNPANPVRLGSCDTPGLAYGVAVSGDYAYVADYEAGLQIVDIRDPAQPTLVGTLATTGRAVSVAVSGRYAYLMHEVSGLHVIDVINPTVPVEVGSIQFEHWSYGGDVLVSGNRAYVANEEFQMIDISDPANPVLLGSQDKFYYPSRHGICLSGSTAYAVDGYLNIFDVSGPAIPAYLGSYTGDSHATDAVVKDGYAYLANSIYGLQIVDVTIPTRPTLVGQQPVFSSPSYGVAVSGRYVFKAMGDIGIEVCRVGTADTPLVTSISPDNAPDSGPVSVEIGGSGFQAGAEVRFTRAGQTDIVATDVVVSSPTSITCSFDITARNGGRWNAVVTNPGSLSGFLLDSFTVIDATPPVITGIYVDTILVAAGGRAWVGVDVTDNTGVAGVTADGYELNYMGGAWGKYIPAPALPGVYTATVVARDAAGNATTATSPTYRVAPVVGTTTRALLDPISTSAYQNFIFRIWGKVTKVDDSYFKLDDGSGKPILVYFYLHKLVTGDYVQATGMWQPGATKPSLYASSYSISKLN